MICLVPRVIAGDDFFLTVDPAGEERCPSQEVTSTALETSPGNPCLLVFTAVAGVQIFRPLFTVPSSTPKPLDCELTAFTVDGRGTVVDSRNLLFVAPSAETFAP